MKASKNPITGDKIKSKQTNDKYRDNYDKIFKKEEKENGKQKPPYL